MEHRYPEKTPKDDDSYYVFLGVDTDGHGHYISHRYADHCLIIVKNPGMETIEKSSDHVKEYMEQREWQELSTLGNRILNTDNPDTPTGYRFEARHFINEEYTPWKTRETTGERPTHIVSPETGQLLREIRNVEPINTEETKE